MNTPFHSPTRAGARVALVTCADLPDLEPDDRLVVASLQSLGVRAEPAVWDDPAVEWDSYDLVILRSTWDYSLRREEFVAWAHTAGRLLNRAEVVEWNTDKRYLAELAAAGIPVIPTTFVSANDMWLPPTGPGQYVIKPAVSAGSRDTGRYGPGHEAQAAEHLGRLQRDGRLTMVQPFLTAVDSHGETALMYFADPQTGALAFSHAIRKGPMLRGPQVAVRGLYQEEEITPREPSAVERAVADSVVAALPGDLLYARIDLIPDDEGNPLLIEVELTEPSLFFEHGTGAADRFAAAVAARLSHGRSPDPA